MEFRRFRRLLNKTQERFPVRWRDRFACLHERTPTTPFDRHYVYHVAWAVRVLARTRPERHIDISSSIYFCATASAIVPVEHYDYRPPQLELDQLVAKPGDLSSLPFPDGSVESLSCMHVIEHVGLGRYGDPIDPDGDLKAVAELKRVVAPSGQLLFVVPTGRPRIAFNAHRIYSFRHVMDLFDGWDLVHSALIPDRPDTGHLIEHPKAELVDAQRYGCGCFLFRKPAPGH